MGASLLGAISDWAVPFLLIIIPLYGLSRRVSVYESFIEGAKDGFETAVRLIPFLVAMFVGVSVFRESGAMEWLLSAVAPIAGWIRLPEEVAPLAILRPLSGSGSLGYVSELLTTHGPDSAIGRMASTAQGSSETTFYVLTVYFGAVGIKKIRYALWVGLIADLAGLISSIFIVRAAFGP